MAQIDAHQRHAMARDHAGDAEHGAIATDGDRQISTFNQIVQGFACRRVAGTGGTWFGGARFQPHGDSAPVQEIDQDIEGRAQALAIRFGDDRDGFKIDRHEGELNHRLGGCNSRRLDPCNR